MKKLFGIWLLLVFGCLGLLMSQTYEDGKREYKKALFAKIINDDPGARKALEEAFKIFKPLASKRDYKSLIMYYLLSIKLKKPFQVEDDLFYYVKEEHQDFSTIEQIGLNDDDKIEILDRLREIARENEKKARTYLGEARKYSSLEEYSMAVDELKKAEKLWNLSEIHSLKKEYERLKREKKLKHIKEQIADLIKRERYQDALLALNGVIGSLSTGEINSLEGEIKKKWHDQLLKKARKELKKNNFSQVQKLCDEAYRIIPSKEASKLKQKIQKKINRMRKTTFWVLNGDYGAGGSLNLNLLDYHWTGNSNKFANITDSGTVKTEPLKKTNYNYSLGLMRMFSPTVGLMISASFLKEQLNVFSTYKYSWTWWDGDSGSTKATMSDSGRVSLVPINFDLLLASKIGSRLSINIYGGATLFLAEIDLKARVGYGGVYKRGSHVYAEWFPFEYEIRDRASYLGGNAGIELEYNLNSYYSTYIRFQYFVLPTQEIGMEVVDQSYSGQIWDIFTVGSPYGLSHLPDYSASLGLSTYTINAGIKLYL